MAVPSASGSGIVNKGTTYGASSQVTSTNINAHVDDAVFNTNAVDGTTINADSNGKNLFVVDGSISVAKTSFLGTVDTTADSTVRILSKQSDGQYDSVTPSGDVTMSQAGAFTIGTDKVVTDKILNSNVTKAKIENVANMKVLGNTSGSAAAPEEVTINDTDDMSDASATTIATSESIKAYVDSQTTDNLPYTIHNTDDARDGQSQEKWQGWSAVKANAEVGSFQGTGGATDDNTEFVFAATGTYYVEFSTLFRDNDTTSSDGYQLKIAATKAGTAIQLGPSIDLIIEPFYKEVLAAATTYSKNISFKYTVNNTTNDRLCFFSAAVSAADLASWEAYGAVKITKIS